MLLNILKNSHTLVKYLLLILIFFNTTAQVNSEPTMKQLLEINRLENQKNINNLIEEHDFLAAKKEAVTQCDLHTSHAQSPDVVAEGVTDAAIDVDSAFHYCTEALKHEDIARNPRYLFQMGRVVLKMKDYQDAHEYFRKAASVSYYPASYYLGLMYQNGYGVQRNPEQAKQYYLTAARHEFKDAQNTLIAMNVPFKTIRQEQEEARQLAIKQENDRIAKQNADAEREKARIALKEAKIRTYLSKNPNREPTNKEIVTALNISMKERLQTTMNMAGEMTNNMPLSGTMGQQLGALIGLGKELMTIGEQLNGVSLATNMQEFLNDSAFTKVVKTAPCGRVQGLEGYVCKFRTWQKIPFTGSSYVSSDSKLHYYNLVWYKGRGWRAYIYEPSMGDGYF